MKNFRSLLIALCALALIACGDDTVDLGPGDPDSGVEDDASTQLPPDEEEDEDDEGRGDDPGDGDDGPGDDPGDEPGDGDDGPGDGTGQPGTLAFRVEDEAGEPYEGATVRIVGVDEVEAATTDAEGLVAIDVPQHGAYLVLVEGLGDDWSYVYPLELVDELTRPSTITMPDRGLFALFSDAISEANGIVFFHFIVDQLGGQSAHLEHGSPFITVGNDEEWTTADLIPGDKLTDESGPIVIYVNVPPGPLTPSYESENPGEVCEALIAPTGGLSSRSKTLVLLPIVCQTP